MKGKQISKNFWQGEFGIDSTSTPTQIRNVENLVHGLLQPLRDKIGKPVIIDPNGSGLRSVKLNAAIGGDPLSQHLTGQAADPRVKGMDPKALADLIKKEFVFDVLIYYKPNATKYYPNGGVHVSYVRGANRNLYFEK